MSNGVSAWLLEVSGGGNDVNVTVFLDFPLVDVRRSMRQAGDRTQSIYSVIEVNDKVTTGVAASPDIRVAAHCNTT